MNEKRLAGLRPVAPYLVLAGALLLFFWPVWLLGYSFPRGGGDLWGQLTPVWSYIARHLRRGVISLWSTQMMAGDPIVGEPQYGLFNPVNSGFFLIGAVLNGLPRWAILLRGVAPLYLAGAGLYVYLRRSDLWRLSAGPALVGGLAYMLADPFLIHLGHPHFDDAIAWLPWALLAIDTVLQRRRVVGWASLPIAAIVLAGHSQASFFTGAAVGLYALWRLATSHLIQRPPSSPTPWWHDTARLLLVGVCGLALAMPAVIPSLERYPLTERAILQLEPWRGYQWPAAMTIDLIAPGFHGRGVRDFWASWARVEGGYAGATALFLGVLGMTYNLISPHENRRAIQRQRALFLLLLGALAVSYALGYDGPIYPTLARLDLIARMHKTARAIYLLSFVIAITAAAGVEAIQAAPVRQRRRVGLALAGAALLLWTLAPRWTSAVPPERRVKAITSLHLAAGTAGCVAMLAGTGTNPRRGRAAPRTTALFLLLLGELILTGTWVEVEPQGGPSPNLPAIDYLQSDPNWFRVDVDAEARGLLSPAVLLRYGFEVPQGSGNPMELFSYTQFYWAVPTKGAPVYQLMGAKYIVVPSGALPGGEGIWPVYTDAPLVDVHLNTNALPRVWLVYDTQPVATIEEAYAVVFDEAFAPVRTATIEDPQNPAASPDLNGEGQGTLEMLGYGPNRVEILVRTSERAMVILSDMHYPGWTASVDGNPTTLYKANGIFRGIIVEEGEHRVLMRYAPTSLRLGLGLAAMAMLVLLTTIWRHHIRPPTITHAS